MAKLRALALGLGTLAILSTAAGCGGGDDVNAAQGEAPKDDSVATSTADEPACSAITEPPSSSTAADIASPTTSAICHGPLPIQPISASPTPTPTETPTTSSPTRRSRCPSETPRQTTAAIGAKNGCWCPITRVATTQARPADRALWTIGSAAPRDASARPVSGRPSRERTGPAARCAS